MPFRDLPKHPCIEIGRVTLAETAGASTPDAEAPDGGDEAPLLRVRRSKITTAPSPPAPLAGWVKKGWEDPDGAAEVEPTQLVERDGQAIIEQFSADPTRVVVFEQWRAAWSVWAETERPARRAMKIFERLYQLRGQIERESESVELLLGDGRLRWRTVEGVIDHPVLLQRVELEFDSSVPEFRLLDADRAPELYGLLLQGGDGLAGAKLNELRIELEKGGYHPLAGPETSAYLARLATLLHAQGQFVEQYAEQPAREQPVLMRDPVLFLRTRMSGFPAAFQRILDDLDDAPNLPVSITRLVGVEPQPWADPDLPPASPWSEAPDVLLSKPANQEQVQIARALERHRAVLVQGPPGTGKSHTIANLIGHLVAQGKRVLVTSHATKALRVLHGQIVESLQPLAVAVLDKDLDSRAQMERAVRGILSRLTVATDELLSGEASSIRARRERLINDIEQLTADLRKARAAEYQVIQLAGEAVEPAEATRWVRSHQQGNDWIPGPVQTGAPLPLGAEELRRLYEINGLLTKSEEAEINARLPDPAALPGTERFSVWVNTPHGEETAAVLRLWEQPAGEDVIEPVKAFRKDLVAVTAEFDALVPWQRQLVAAGHAGEVEWSLWASLAESVTEAHRLWQAHRAILVEHEVTGSCPGSAGDARATVAEILRYLEGGGKVGAFQRLLHPSWKALCIAFQVDGEQPSSQTHFQAVAAYLELSECRDNIRRRWSRQAEPIGLPAMDSLGEKPEAALLELSRSFPALGAWWEASWAKVTERAGAVGLRLDVLRQSDLAASMAALPFERDVEFLRRPLIAALDVRLGIARSLRAGCCLRELDANLSGFAGNLAANLLSAVRARDVAAYDVALAELRRVSAKQDIWRERHNLTAKLGTAAPGWADALRSRSGVHGGTTLPGEAPKAWRWRQLQEEIERRIALDEAELLRRLEQRRQELRTATADLIDRQAWLAQLKRTGLAARQALQGWADTVRKIGKGTGKRTAELQGQARRLLVQARNAVPVWIMPLSRVAESFDPTAGRFDVVIVDEASQSDIQGLLAWYLGDRIAIVGDHEQVSPMAVGQQIDVVKALIEQHLHEVPNQHLYDGKTSVYDLGRQCFGGTIALREHFRCVPDIIEFSNALSYDYEIRPLRNPSTAAPPHVAEFVTTPDIGTGRDGKTNLAEARAVTALMAAATELPEYAGKSFGAITLLGDEQAVQIQQLAVDLLGAVALESRRFVAGNSAQFQGDERDVMFLSMVDSPAGGVLRVVQTPEMKQRYNVAASRAKDQLWVVHSLDPKRDLQTADLRRRLIDHVRDPGARRRELEKKARRAESQFEVEVLKRLMAANYDVRPQVWVGKYRIDFVVCSGQQEVAVECDGDRYHGFDDIMDDMSRQAVLERAGWRFIRIRGTRFFFDPEETMAAVFAELERLGISSAAIAPTDGAQPAGMDLRDVVVRRAWEIMRERGWIENGNQ
ncbi:MAG: hypothetical protein AMXMBFR8_03190 [Nevskiales bacterium]